MTVAFQNIPGSGVFAPIITFEFNSGERYRGGSRLYLIGCKTSLGALVAGAPQTVGSQDDADALAGPGSMLREMYRVVRANNIVTPVYLCAVDDSSGTAGVWRLTLNSVPAAGTAVFGLNGMMMQFAVSATDTVTTVAANIAAAINGFYDPLTRAMLPFTATSAAGVVTITSRHKVAIYNDLALYVPWMRGANVLAASGVVTFAVTTPGAGIPTLSAALAATGDYRSEVISPWSDDVSIAAYKAWSNDVNGVWSWARQVYGHVWTTFTGSFSATTTLGLSLNDRHLTIKRRIPGVLSDPATWITGRAAAELVWLLDCTTGNVSRNQTGRPVYGVVGLPSDRMSSLDNYTARNQLLQAGISTFSQMPDGTVTIDKTVTTYSTGASGQPDTEFSDVQSVYQIAGGFSYIRAMMATEQGQKSLAATNPYNNPNVSTPKDIKASFYHGYTQMVHNGVFQQLDPTTDLVCDINSGNPDRVDLGAKIRRVNPLDIIAGNATFYSQTN